MAHDVFISHSSKDKATADAVCAVLESHGVRCWVAPRDIVPGRDWGASIVGAIKEARVMVLVFSEHANNSPQIRLEVERAVSKGIPIIPLRIEDMVPTESLELFLGLRHWLDAYTPPLEQHLNYLVRVVREIIGGPPTAILPVPTVAEREAKEKAEAVRLTEEKHKATKEDEENRRRAEGLERSQLGQEQCKPVVVAPNETESKKKAAFSPSMVGFGKFLKDAFRKHKPLPVQSALLVGVTLILALLSGSYFEFDESTKNPVWVEVLLISGIIFLFLGFLFNLTGVCYKRRRWRLLFYLCLGLFFGCVAEGYWSVMPTVDEGDRVISLNIDPWGGLSNVMDRQLFRIYQHSDSYRLSIYRVVNLDFDQIVYDRGEAHYSPEGLKLLWLGLLPVDSLLWFFLFGCVFEVYRRLGRKSGLRGSAAVEMAPLETIARSNLTKKKEEQSNSVTP
jgi:hypothetical protein